MICDYEMRGRGRGRLLDSLPRLDFQMGSPRDILETTKLRCLAASDMGPTDDPFGTSIPRSHWYAV